ncbi:MAG: MarC family protein [Victivallales bacterium]
MDSFVSTLILFFLVMNPLGNLPVFIAVLSRTAATRYRLIVVRESLIALGVLLLFLFCGGAILKYLNLTQASFELSGGIILFMIAIKLVFSSAAKEANSPESPAKEPFVVPLAIPLFAGPATMSTAIIVGGKGGIEASLFGSAALIMAWGICTLILMSGRYVGKFLGVKALSALESLMGLLLTTMAFEMMIKGIKLAFHLK